MKKERAVKVISGIKLSGGHLISDSLQKAKNRFENKFEVKGESECWLWEASTFPNGYGQFLFEGKSHGAHRISFLMYSGIIPDGLQVCHSCDNPPCVNPSHLFLGTNQDNCQDKKDKGRTHKIFGEDNGNYKLTDEDVINIRCSTLSAKILAEKYKISINHVYQIKSKRRRQHLKP